MADDGSGASNTIWPIPKFVFSVDIPDIGTDIRFQEVSGLDIKAQPIEYRTGNSKVFSTVKMPGLVKHGDVTLKKGVVVAGNGLWGWLAERNPSLIKRRDVTIKLLDQEGKLTMVWTLANAFPTKITAMDMKADANEVAVDTLVFAHEGVTIVNQ